VALPDVQGSPKPSTAERYVATEEETMHAVIVNVTIADADAATGRLRDEIVPRVSSAPGFVAGYWVRTSGNKGISTVVFESEGAAQGVAQMIRDQPPDDDSVSLDSIEVGEVVANA
jgi:hypothetical protein